RIWPPQLRPRIQEGAERGDHLDALCAQFFGAARTEAANIFCSTLEPALYGVMSVPGIGVLSSLAYVSTVEDPGRFSRSDTLSIAEVERPIDARATKYCSRCISRGAARSTGRGVGVCIVGVPR